jgi:hypothetical protein
MGTALGLGGTNVTTSILIWIQKVAALSAIANITGDLGWKKKRAQAKVAEFVAKK